MPLVLAKRIVIIAALKVTANVSHVFRSVGKPMGVSYGSVWNIAAAEGIELVRYSRQWANLPWRKKEMTLTFTVGAIVLVLISIAIIVAICDPSGAEIHPEPGRDSDLRGHRQVAATVCASRGSARPRPSLRTLSRDAATSSLPDPFWRRSLHKPVCRPSLSCVANRRFVEFSTYALASHLRASWIEARVSTVEDFSSSDRHLRFLRSTDIP
jgi:hypothetical protein